ncbi:hypothetical protein VNO77_37728 [Canavalia gladiata]|uniref:Uncharacterized protein n=1 Tax=Canavalia gladiata TaxID=3824 RepID=A0AAN9PUX1_CANGL
MAGAPPDLFPWPCRFCLGRPRRINTVEGDDFSRSIEFVSMLCFRRLSRELHCGRLLSSGAFSDRPNEPTQVWVSQLPGTRTNDVDSRLMETMSSALFRTEEDRERA